MTGSSLEKLFFVVSLIDRVSKPSKLVSKSIQQVQRTAKEGFMNIGKGALSIGAAAASLSAFTGPAREFNRALGEVASLGVAQDELDKLGVAGKRFAVQFGGNAAEVVRSGYDIQSAIPGLAKGALAEFTYQGALLAKAGKSNAATITKYQGTMYNIFERDAKRIGEARWIEQLTGKTAYAIKMFKTTGDEMSSAFTNLGSVGQISGVSMDEQMAVLGTLQGTMGGANAGTAYKAFLNKIGMAQKTLGMSFTDSQGKMLPIVEILEKIRTKVGDGNLSTADATKLMQAFGDEGGKAVMNLLGKTDQLRGSIGELQDISDASGALRMAEAMTDPLDRFNGVLGVIRVTLGQSLLPIVNVFLSAMARGLTVFQWLLDNIPPLRWLLTAIAIGVAAVSIAFGALWITVGAMNILDALTAKMKILRRWMIFSAHATNHNTLAYKAGAAARFIFNQVHLIGVGIQKLSTAAQWLWNTSLKSGVFWQKASAIYTGILNLLLGKQTVATGAAAVATSGLSWATIKLTLQNKALALWTGICKVATIGFKMAMFALKLVMLAGAIPAALATAAALGIYKLICIGASAVSWLLTTGLWAVVTAVWSFTVALLACPLTWIVLGIVALIGALVAVVVYWDKVKAAAVSCWNWIADKASWCWELLTGGVKAYLGVWLGVWDAIRSGASSVFGWISEMWDNTVGLVGKAWNWLFGGSETKVEQIRKEEPVMESATSMRRSTDVAAGGIRSSVANNTTNYGGVTINTTAFPGPGELEDYMALQA